MYEWPGIKNKIKKRKEKKNWNWNWNWQKGKTIDCPTRALRAQE